MQPSTSHPSSPTPSSPSSPSRSSSKRPLSSPAPSTAALKRHNSEDPSMTVDSDHEGSIGASRLNIASTPRSIQSDGDPEGDDTLLAEDENEVAGSPPAYEELAGGYNGPAAENQLATILDLQRMPLERGDSWYLISRQWFRRWQVACSASSLSKEDEAEFGGGLSPEEVGPIDQSAITGEDGALRRSPPVQEGVDVELLPAAAWGMLNEWYGLNGATFERQVLSPAGPGSETLEFYPPTFQFFLLLPTSPSTSSPVRVPSLEHAPSTSLPSSASFSQLLEFASSAFSLSPDPARSIRLWRLPPAGDADTASNLSGPAFVFADKLRESGVELLPPSSCTTTSSLADALLTDPETRLAVEQQKADGSWIVDAEQLVAAIALAGTAEEVPPQVVEVAGEAAKEKKKSHGLFSHGWSSGLHIPGTGHKKKDAASSSSSAASAAAEKKEGGAGGFVAGLTSALSSTAASAGGALTRSRTAAAAGGGRQGQRGLVGLTNLGNTCFMNSALQCMSNTKELQEYFTSGVYRSELNPSNPLGMGGKVAVGFGELLEAMWSGRSSTVAPREFKQALARFAPQFSGYGQQDSQELLAFLLDGTHEDLNRILKKPATEAPDWMGGGEREMVEMARTCWEQYRSRNDSVIVDLFQGQYRSTVVCPDCDKVSITFDPFMYVTTNLPVTKKWSGRVIVVPLDPAKGVLSVEFEVPKTGTIKTLKTVVGGLTDIDPKKFIVAEEWSHKMYKEWTDDELVTEISSNDRLVLFESSAPYTPPKVRYASSGFMSSSKKLIPAEPASEEEAAAKPVHLVLAHEKAPPSRPAPAAGSSSGSGRLFGMDRSMARQELFGTPVVLSLSQAEVLDENAIRRAVARQYSRVTARGEELIRMVEEDIAAREAEKTQAQQQNGQKEDASATASSSSSSSANFSSAPSTIAAESSAPSTVPSPPLSDSATMDVDPSSSTSAAPASLNAAISSLPAKPSDLAAATATPAPRRPPPFRLLVLKRPQAPAGQIPLSEAKYGDPSELLEDRVETVRRIARKEKLEELEKLKQEAEKANGKGEQEDVDMFAVAPVKEGESAGVEAKSEGEQPDASSASAPPAAEQQQQPSSTADLAATASAASSAAVPSDAELDIPRRPLVKTGHVLLASWDPAAFEYFFGAEAGLWEKAEQVVDPAILARRQKGKGEKKVITLDECLREFTKEERLGEDNMYYCSRCKDFKQATKKVELWKAPDVLVFALKRFSSGRYSRDKLDDFVDFPLEGLDMEPFIEGDRVEKRLAEQLGDAAPPTIVESDSLTYDLYAVSNHFGGLGGGHYTAFAKNHENGRWYDFDDSRVSEISPDRVRSSAAYLLFYRRRTARPIGGAKARELVESATASRVASAAPSAAASVVGQNSPLASRDNLASSFHLANEAPNVSDSDEDLFNATDDEAHLPGAFSGHSFVSAGGGGGGFTGMFPPPSAQLASPPDSPEPGSPKDFSGFMDEWTNGGGPDDSEPPSLAVSGQLTPLEQPEAVEPPAQEIRLEEADGDLEKIE